jgi:3-phenylpropionate/trans-cinnamate dioxygenase ferredoxin reductase component
VADVVVVGAGLAGARICTLLRSAGVTGRVVLLGAEADPPYDRPPLTKDPDAEVDLRPAMGVDVWAHADEVRLGVGATGLVVGEGIGPVVLCSDGREVGARAVVAACGANAVLPPGWTRAGVHVLHTRRDAAGFWPEVGPGVRLVIVGGGWVGCEAAATATARGAEVDLVEASDSVLAGRVPPEVSGRIERWLEQDGVRVHRGRRVEGIEQERGTAVVSGLPADVVLVALGVQPATGWLAEAGVARSSAGAVLVDPWGRSGVPGLFAVGDAAARWSDRYGTHLPGGHWTEALNAPESVAPAVAQWVAGGLRDHGWGTPPTGVPVADPIPYVFSDLGARRLLVLGDPGRGRVVLREDPGAVDPPAEAWSAFTLDASDRLVGMCTSGRPRDMAAARRAMLAHPAGTPRTDPAALADPGAPPAAMFPGEG